MSNHRFFVPSRQKDHGDMRLANLNLAGLFGARRRARQSMDQADKVHLTYLSFNRQPEVRVKRKGEPLPASRIGDGAFL